MNNRNAHVQKTKYDRKLACQKGINTQTAGIQTHLPTIITWQAYILVSAILWFKRQRRGGTEGPSYTAKWLGRSECRGRLNKFFKIKKIYFMIRRMLNK